MSESTSNTESTMRSDICLVLATSLILLAYLTASLLQPAETHAGEEDLPPEIEEALDKARQATAEKMREVLGAVKDKTLETSPPEMAPWVRKDEPVPSWVLYPYSEDSGHWAPAPPEPAKKQTWFNRLLFPPKHCVYCGRRVPNKKGSYLFLVIGFVGQVGFSLRFLVQWLASEKAGRSVMPEAFWWLSIFGSLLLLVYSISILAWPIILGQTPNVFIYARNLYFIRVKEKRLPKPDAPETPDK